MTQVVVAIGSNQDREANIGSALTSMHSNFGDLTISQVYESAGQSKQKNLPENETSIAPYYNLVVCFNSALSVAEIKSRLLEIEAQQGRERHTDSVSIDLDLLLYGDWVGKDKQSILPHPDILECDYVLRPLSDLLPDMAHPVVAKRYLDLWLSLEKKTQLVPVDFVWQSQLISTAVNMPSL